MAFTFSQSQDAVATAALKKVARPYFEDNVLRGIPTLKYLMAADRYVPCDGGSVIAEPVRLGKNGTAGHFAPMADLPVFRDDGKRTNALYDWARYSVQIAYPFDNDVKVSGESAQINLLKDEMASAAGDLREAISVDLFGTGDGTDDETLCGLQNLVSVTPTTTVAGRIDPAVAGQSAWANQANANAITFNTSNAGETAWQTGLLNATFGKNRPSIIVTSRTIWGLYSTAQRTKGQVMFPAGVGDSGYDPDALDFAGMPVVWDRHIDQTDDASGIDGPGATFAYMLDLQGLKLRYSPKMNFEVIGPERPANKAAKYWSIMTWLQLTCNSRRSNVVFSNMS